MRDFYFVRAEQSLLAFSLVICVALHLATFVFDFPFSWVFLAFIPIFLSAIIAKMHPQGVSFEFPVRVIRMLGFALLVYSIVMFVYEYKLTGGANHIAVENGQCLAMDKSTIIRILTDSECRHFPTLWTRVMSSWTAAIACFGLVHSYDRSGKLAR